MGPDRAVMLLLLASCAHALPEEQACLEVGPALGSRTEECEGDRELALARMEALEKAYQCDMPQDLPAEYDTALFECALIVRNLACELALEYGDDLDAWLDSSPVCRMILAPR